MAYPEAAWERAMKVQDVILKALSGPGGRTEFPAPSAPRGAGRNPVSGIRVVFA